MALNVLERRVLWTVFYTFVHTDMLRFGPIELDSPAVLAALSGYSDWPMRRISRQLGASYTLCEVLLDQFVVNVTKGRKAKRYLRVDDEDHPVGAQLMGSEPGQFSAAAQRLVEAGFDCIDINFGCPVKKVLGRCRGGFLLSQPQTALEIVERVRDVVPPAIPVTVKMRRAMDDSSESRDRFFEIYDGAVRLGAAAVTVHGRTVRQGYQGNASWDFLRELKAYAPERVLLGSGDLFTAKACVDMLATTGSGRRHRRSGCDRQPVDLPPVSGSCCRRSVAAAPLSVRAARRDRRNTTSWPRNCTAPNDAAR